MDWRQSCYRTADVDRGSDGDEVEAAEEEEILAAVLQMGHQA